MSLNKIWYERKIEIELQNCRKKKKVFESF